MIRIENNQVFSDTGKMVRRKGSDNYFRRSTSLPGYSADMFEEVDSVPTYTKGDYDREVERLIAERYTTGQEIQFAREKEEAGEKYSEYLAYVEACKLRAVENLTADNCHWHKNQVEP